MIGFVTTVGCIELTGAGAVGTELGGAGLEVMYGDLAGGTGLEITGPPVKEQPATCGAPMAAANMNTGTSFGASIRGLYPPYPGKYTRAW
jgi:hypothetical protein